MAGAGAQATQLDFHQAMQDFRVMFPDMDANVIEAVLRSNHGAVHATIDQLLTMTTDIEADLMRGERMPPALLLQQSVPDVVPTPRQGASLREDSSEDLLTWDGRGGVSEGSHQVTPAIMIGEQPPSYSLFASPPPSYHQAVLPPLASGPPSSPPSLRRSHNWHPPLLLPLPPDFLRLPPACARAPQVSGCGLVEPALCQQHLCRLLPSAATSARAY